MKNKFEIIIISYKFRVLIDNNFNKKYKLIIIFKFFKNSNIKVRKNIQLNFKLLVNLKK